MHNGIHLFLKAICIIDRLHWRLLSAILLYVNSVVRARAQGELEECFSHVGIFGFRNSSKNSRNLRLEEAQTHLLRIQKALVIMFGARKN